MNEPLKPNPESTPRSFRETAQQALALLRQEGIAREFINRIQNLRKEMGLDVQDKIKILVENKDELISNALQMNKEYICNETQAIELGFSDDLPDGKKFEMDDLEVTLKIEK